MADLRDALERIRAKGALTPEAVVKAARPRTSELHDRFVWDDHEAAELHRLATAGQLIRSVRISEKRADGETRQLRNYWPRHEEGRLTWYEPLEQIAQDPVAAGLLVSALEREWMQFKRRWSHIAEFVEIVQRSLNDDAA